MSTHILTENIANISDLKAKPMQIIARAKGGAVTIVNRNKPVFYAIPVALFNEMQEKLDDLEAIQLIKERQEQETIKVSLNDL